jgi:hypothetical protein
MKSLMKKILITLIIGISITSVGFAFKVSAASATPFGTFTGTATQTATAVTVNYHYIGTPTETFKVYSWLGVVNSSKWIDRSNLLTTVNASSTEVTKDFSVTYDFTALGLTGNGTKYVYYLADGTTDSANLLYGAANFTVGTAATPTYTITATGQYKGQAAGMYQEGFSVKATVAPTQNVSLALKIFKNCSTTCTLLSTNPVPISAGSTAPVSPSSDDLGPGSYTANLYSGSDVVGLATFTIVSQVPTFEMEVSSVMVPANIATIKGTITATRTDLPNGHLVLKIGASPSTLTTTKVAYSGDISLTGVSFTVASDSLDTSSNLQYYKFTETTTGTDLASGSFALNTATDQSAGPAYVPGDDDGTCNPTYDTTVANPVTASTPSLCSNGTVASFAGDATSGPWTWKCTPVTSKGSTDSCTATLASSTNPAATPPAQSNDPANYLQNPLSKELNSFPKIFAAIMNNVIMPVMVIFLPMMLIYSGFLFVIARKRESVNGIENAKTTFKWTIIGAIIILGATVIANALQGTVTQIFGINNAGAQAPSTTQITSTTTNTGSPSITDAVNAAVTANCNYL